MEESKGFAEDEPQVGMLSPPPMTGEELRSAIEAGAGNVEIQQTSRRELAAAIFHLKRTNHELVSAGVRDVAPAQASCE